MSNLTSRYYRIFSLAIPSLIAIISLELVTVVMYNYGPLKESLSHQLLWLALQTFAGVIFAYISDCRFRKATLVASQFLGVIGGIILTIFNMELWVIILIAGTFNPLPVARAALLDNFPKYSSLRIIGFTFLAQAFPWILFSNVGEISLSKMIIFIIALMGINLFLTIFLFKDNYDKKEVVEHKDKMFNVIKTKPRLKYVLGAFIFSEMTFYLLLDFLEYDSAIRSLLSATSIATFLGMAIAMIYSRLPHLSIITLCYSIGAAAMAVLIFECIFYNSSCKSLLINTMTQFSIVGGLYLPFVTDAVIGILGPKHKALGSAFIEIAGTIAVFAAPIMSLFMGGNMNVMSISIVFLIFYLCAAFLQKYAEKHKFMN